MTYYTTIPNNCPICGGELSESMSGWVHGFDIYHCCPNCGSINTMGSGSSISCKHGGHTTILSDNINCKDCGWSGTKKDGITIEEFVNNDRLKKLNDIL